MLIRFVVKNLFSFNEATEFNMLPGKATRLKHHKYKLNNEIEVLKLAAIYGANASGKSNLVKALLYLRAVVLAKEIPRDFESVKYKLLNSNLDKPVEFSIEFISHTNIIYYYSVVVNKEEIIEEYLSKNISKVEDELVFHRKINQTTGNATIQFYKGFEVDEKNKLLKEVIETNLLKKNQSLIYILYNLIPNYKNNNKPTGFEDIENVLMWFSRVLNIIQPHTKYSQLPIFLEKDNNFKEFAIDILKSSNTGIIDLEIETIFGEDFFGQDNKNEANRIKNELDSKSVDMVYSIVNNEVFNFCYEDGKVVAKKIWYKIQNENNKKILFHYNELSDGTKRILDYLKLTFDIIHYNSVYFIDEMERSIHPILIKEIISKFSKEESSKGQLIFTSHESNLLDQDILRTDEIWFAEKNNRGETKLYSLSDFKEHSTIDIRKGYLQGRYGGIPFISNLQDLNWHKEDVAEK